MTVAELDEVRNAVLSGAALGAIKALVIGLLIFYVVPAIYRLAFKK